MWLATCTLPGALAPPEWEGGGLERWAEGLLAPPRWSARPRKRTRQKWLVNVYNDTPADGVKLPCGDRHLRGASHLGKPSEQRAWGLPRAGLPRALPSSPKPPPSSQHWTTQDSWLEERLKAVHRGRGAWGNSGNYHGNDSPKGKRRHTSLEDASRLDIGFLFGMWGWGEVFSPLRKLPVRQKAFTERLPVIPAGMAAVTTLCQRKVLQKQRRGRRRPFLEPHTLHSIYA